MAIRIVRLGSARAKGEGLRIGTVRRPPRGVPKERWAAEDYFDVWFPNLAPSEALVKSVFPITDEKGMKTLRRRYLAELKTPAARHELSLLAALSRHTDISVGCYCEDESRCHRAILREVLVAMGADVAPAR